MRVLILTGALTLAVARGASAAVAAVPTGENPAIVVERPDISEREAAPDPPYSFSASVIASVGHEQACNEYGWYYTQFCPVSTYTPPQAPPSSVAAVEARAAEPTTTIYTTTQSTITVGLVRTSIA